MGPLSIPTLRKDKKSQSKPTGVCGSNCSSSGSEAAQDPAGTSELVHTLEMWQFTPGKSMIQWVEGKKTYPKLTSFMNLSSITQLTRVHEDWGKQYEEAERAHSPPLPIRRASNFQDTQMPRVCWRGKAPVCGKSPTETISFLWQCLLPSRARFLLQAAP